MNWDLQAQCDAPTLAGSQKRFTVTERLEAEKRSLEDRLAQVNKVLEALKGKPDFQELFDLISKTI